MKAYGRKPNYVQSWHDVAGTSFRLRDMGRTKNLELKWFDFDPDGRAHLNSNRVPQDFEDAAAHRMLARRKQEAEANASHIFGRLLSAGTITCEAARVLAAFCLGSAEDRTILEGLLRARFAEVIVDEAQDCGREELGILAFLRDCGIGVVMVGDVDQSIYEFRNATPAAVQEFAASLPVQLALEDNWRSSPAIVAFNSGLRSGQLLETARGEHSIVQTPVHLIEFSTLDQIVPAALKVAEQYKLVADDLIVLSHAETHGMKAAGVVGLEAAGSNRVLAIANAGAQLRSRETEPKARKKAVDRVQRVILATLTVGWETQHRSFAAICEETSVDPRWLESFAVRLALSLDAEGKTRTGFAASVRDSLKTADWGSVSAPASSDLGNLFKAPSEGAWAGVGGFGNNPSIRYSTVHGVKGLEFPGVVPGVSPSRRSSALCSAMSVRRAMECRSIFGVAKTSSPAAAHRSLARSKTFVQLVYRSGSPLSVSHSIAGSRQSSPSTNRRIRSAAVSLPSALSPVRPSRLLHCTRPARLTFLMMRRSGSWS
ncbi:UvrD/REP helicase N-terminal domain-containing protein [Streptomyces sp. cf124]|uniref:UvrD-helicase domain-containing protein n=1 Tax=Streptomyces sp. cf124 TaxID=1761903 RepID=UPI0008E75E5E|nr:UvrD-helicase domain-containing protein [Streptomyces sp. cf124]SFO06603.1 UvrD/REP helicase N-terminal domain-containing protein [Streptomyces sp. cf124]